MSSGNFRGPVTAPIELRDRVEGSELVPPVYNAIRFYAENFPCAKIDHVSARGPNIETGIFFAECDGRFAVVTVTFTIDAAPDQIAKLTRLQKFRQWFDVFSLYFHVLFRFRSGFIPLPEISIHHTEKESNICLIIFCRCKGLCM